jgi:hypothetical protein
LVGGTRVYYDTIENPSPGGPGGQSYFAVLVKFCIFFAFFVSHRVCTKTQHVALHAAAATVDMRCGKKQGAPEVVLLCTETLW